MDVIIDESAVSAMAGKLFLSILNRPTNSAAMCCASAALPPLPKSIIFFPFLRDFVITFTQLIISGAR